MAVSISLFALLGCGKSAPTNPPSVEETRLSESAGHLSGAVQDDEGRAISLADVVVSSETGKEWNETSDASGRYQILNLEPGSYQVVVTHSGRFAVANGVSVIQGQTTDLAHRLAASGDSSADQHAALESSAGIISGTILDASSREPLGGATVELSNPEMSEALFTLADENGTFRFPNISPATYVVSVYYSLVNKGNVEIRRSGVVVEKGLETKLTLEIDTEARN